MEEQGEELKKQEEPEKEEPENEAPQAEDFLASDLRNEKKYFLGREEIRTMKKDISLIREGEAQKEKERLISLKVERKQEKPSSDEQKKEAIKKEGELRKERERNAKEVEKEKEAKRIEERKRIEELNEFEERKKNEEAKEEEEMRGAREAEKLVEKRKAEETGRIEEERKAEEAKKAEELRKANEAKRAEEARRAEEMRKAREAEKLVERRRAEEAKRIEEERKAEAIRKANETKRAEEVRRAEEIRRAEEARKLEMIRKAKEAEKEAETKWTEKMRMIEDARRMEEIKITEEAEEIEKLRKTEEAKIIEETKKTRERELADEVKEAQAIERAREEEKTKGIKRTKELEEIMKEEEEVPVQTPEIFQEFASFKPEGPPFLSSFKKVLIRFAMVAIIIVLEIFAGFLYWYLAIAPMETEQQQINNTTGKITIPSSLFEIQEPYETIKVSDLEEAALLLPQSLEKRPETGDFTRILVEDTKENKIFELNDFLTAFEVSPPAGLLEKLDDGFTLFVHSDKDSGRFGFIARIKEGEEENLYNDLISWEPTMEKDFENLFASLGRGGNTDYPYFTQIAYKGAVFRYVSFPTYNNFGICWSTYNNYFIWTSSGESMMRTIDALSE